PLRPGPGDLAGGRLPHRRSTFGRRAAARAGGRGRRPRGRVGGGAAGARGACALEVFASPWAAGKGLATASPALLSAAASGCAWLFSRGRPRVGLALATLLGFVVRV